MTSIIRPDQKNNQFPLALVTGAADRIGKAFALSLAGKGYAIAIHFHISLANAMATVHEIQLMGVPAFAIKADLSREVEIKALFSQIDSLLLNPENKLQDLKLLINSAAVMQRSDAKNLSFEEFDAAMGLNLRAPFFCSQMAYARMGAGGLIVNISDVGAQKAWIGYPAYTISKAGLDSLTKVLAKSFAPKVRVNAIAPGLVLPSDEINREDWVRLVSRLPNPRTAALDELCASLEFLIKNEYITGQTLVVDGGYSLL